MDFATLAQAPAKLTAAADGQLPTSRIQVAVLADDFTDPRYGDFAITREHVANWQRLLASQFGGRVHIDLDHGTDYNHDQGSRAAGWILALDHMGADGATPTPDEVWALVEWTPLGQEKIASREYMWISPTFTDDYVDNRGNHHGPALARAALTNDPFLREMATVSLSGAPLAYRRAAATASPADSRRQMTLPPKIAEALGLDADADEAKVLSAIGDLKTAAANKADDPDPAKLLKAAPVKTLTEALAEHGLVALTRDEHAALKADALAGKGAADELHTAKFDTAYQACLDAGSIDTSEDTKKEWRELYDAAPEVTLKRLAAVAAGPKLVQLDRGRGQGGGDTAGEVAAEYDGDAVDEERAEMVTEARKLAAEKNIPFTEAARQVALSRRGS
ncbi:MAG TPA: phage protease [Capillimicrobium sp.]|nr:phage protease [Capillimicrobium sp.]